MPSGRLTRRHFLSLPPPPLRRLRRTGRFSSFARCATEDKPCAAGVVREFEKNTQGEIQMREERSGVPDSAHRFDASRVRAGASTGVPARKRVVCHTGVNENNPFLAIPRAHAPARRGVRSETALAAWRVKTFGGNYDPVRDARACPPCVHSANDQRQMLEPTND